MLNPIPFEIDYDETKRNIRNLLRTRGVSIRTLLNDLSLTDPAALFTHPDLEKLVALAAYLNVPILDLLVLKNQNSSVDSAQQSSVPCMI